jgi:Protein of unknown function (DUF3830)
MSTYLKEPISRGLGGACQFASKMGQLAGNHFLTVMEGAENLLPLGRMVLWQGAQQIEFRAP